MTDEQVAVKIQEIDDRSKSNVRRLNEIDIKLESNDKMLASIARLDQKQSDMDSDIKEIKSDVKIIAGKPGKRWEGIIDKALLAIVTALVAYALSKIGF